ncbi:MAG: SIS domain-containing protein, partial [Acetatifactor sp.]|nr:SIS domain-containing protein [Acetatifactor sp.]
QDAPHTNEGFIASISRDYRQMLLNTSAMLDEDTLLAAVECIKESNNIYVFSFSNTSFVASELDFKLSLAGLRTKAVTDLSSMRIQASNVKKDDLVIFIVPTVLMRDIYQALSICRERDAKILTITSYDSPKLNDLVDFKFITSDKLTAKNSATISNNMMYLFVVDIIYSYLLENDKALRQKKLTNDAILNNQQMIDNYMLEY